jgi:hypothetical protein
MQAHSVFSIREMPATTISGSALKNGTIVAMRAGICGDGGYNAF